MFTKETVLIPLEDFDIRDCVINREDDCPIGGYVWYMHNDYIRRAQVISYSASITLGRNGITGVLDTAMVGFLGDHDTKLFPSRQELIDHLLQYAPSERDEE